MAIKDHALTDDKRKAIRNLDGFYVLQKRMVLPDLPMIFRTGKPYLIHTPAVLSGTDCLAAFLAFSRLASSFMARPRQVL